MKQEDLDWFIMEPATNDPENLHLEILVHFVDKDGNRTRPSSNRITIPFQTKEIKEEESAILPMLLLNAIVGSFQRNEFLHRLVRDPKRVERLKTLGNNNYHRLYECACMPRLDHIESLNIPYISLYGDLAGHHKSLSDLLPDIYDQNQTKDSKT